MALFKFTVKVPLFRNCIRLEKGMSVNVVMSGGFLCDGGEKQLKKFIPNEDLQKRN